MRLNSYLASALLVAGALFVNGCAGSGEAMSSGRAAAALACATPNVSAAKLAAIDVELASIKVSKAPLTTINVHFHIISNGLLAVEGGDITQQQVDDQILQLNAAYESFGYHFALVDVTRTTNPSWFTMTQGSPEEAAAKLALHEGTAVDLNLYSIGGTVRGFSTFPWDYAPATSYMDGVMVRFDTTPGGAATGYNEGDSAVHEVGHWLGLYHTFEFGCAAQKSDGVQDTVPQATGTEGCPVGKDTCADNRGPDPVDNFMDTSDDTCMSNLTAGQGRRVDRMWAKYRKGN